MASPATSPCKHEYLGPTNAPDMRQCQECGALFHLQQVSVGLFRERRAVSTTSMKEAHPAHGMD